MQRGHHPGSQGVGNVPVPIILVRKQCLLPGAEIHHHILHPGRDHMIRTTSKTPSCTVVGVRFQREVSVAELRKRLRASWNLRPTHPFDIIELDDEKLNTRTETFTQTDTSQAAALHASFRTLSRYLDVILLGKINLVKVPHGNCRASTRFW